MIKLSSRALSLLGLARCAGKVSSGFTAVNESITKGKALLLLLDGDCAENTVKQYRSSANLKGIDCFIVENANLCASVGHPERKVLSLTDEGFKKEILKEIYTLNNVGVNDSNE